MKEKYCFNCGQPLPQAAKFCPACGIEQPPVDASQQEAQIKVESIADDNAQSQDQVDSVAATTSSQANGPVSGRDKVDNHEPARTPKAPIFSVNTDQLKEELAELNFKDENKRYLQDFLANNLTLVLAGFALVIFAFIIFDRAAGVIVALGVAGGIYVLAVREKGKTSQLNDRIIQASQQGAKTLQEGQKSLQDQLASRHKQANSQVRSKHQSKSKQGKSSWFITTIVASLLSLYGYIAGDFQIFSTASLNDMITTTIESLNRVIGITSAGNHYFQSTRVADLLATAKLGRTALQVFNLGMIFLPIVTILAVVLKKAGWAFLSASLQLLLALAALMILTYLISTGLGDNALAWLSNFSFDNLTVTGYALIIGLLLAPIASLLTVFSKKISHIKTDRLLLAIIA